MDFTFSEDQDHLRSAVADFLEREAPASYRAAMAEDHAGITDGQWSDLVGLGWPGLLVPAEHGGLGLGLVDMVAVLEEMGKVAYPGPYFSSAVAATLAARTLGCDELLAGLAEGSKRGTVAVEESGAGDPVERVRTRARRKGAQWVITGTKPVVLDGHTADWALVAARTEEGLGTFLVEEPAGEPVPMMDPTRKAARLEMSDRPAEPVGPVGDHAALWRRIVDDCAVMLAAESVGASEAAWHLGVEYAKERVQFDRPIASFQAIKHKAVDMLQAVELARVGTHYAAWASDADDPKREHAAAMCKGFVGEAAVFVSGQDIQIHGGVGFTWDCDAHWFYKRAKVNDLLCGYQGWQRDRLASLVLADA
ncbi:MAG: acyl-CoA dehydrogenase family protein [Acidimicrobiia bacterium]